jgi:hypothetical protein
MKVRRGNPGDQAPPARILFFFLISTGIAAMMGCASPPSEENTNSDENEGAAKEEPDRVSVPCAWEPASGNFLLPSLEAPSSADTSAWIAFYDVTDVRVWDETGIALHSPGLSCNVVPWIRVLVASDTTLHLKDLASHMTGELSFDWEPLCDVRRPKKGCNDLGLQAIFGEDAAGKPYRIDLTKILETEAWTFTADSTLHAKEVLFLDANFDGHLDIWMKRSGGKTSYSTLLLFDPVRGKYFPGLKDLAYPVYHAQKGLLSSYEGGTSNSANWTVYQRNLVTGQYDAVMATQGQLVYADEGSEGPWDVKTYWDVRGGASRVLRVDSVRVAE